jgi:hypothetical protein
MSITQQPTATEPPEYIPTPEDIREMEQAFGGATPTPLPELSAIASGLVIDDLIAELGALGIALTFLGQSDLGRKWYAGLRQPGKPPVVQPGASPQEAIVNCLMESNFLEGGEGAKPAPTLSDLGL